MQLSGIEPYALETWGNTEAIAVNQDPAGKPFIVLPLTPLPPPPSQPAPRAGVVFATVAECGGEPTYQNWTFSTPAEDFLYNGASNQCLNVDACGTLVIFDGCKTSGGTCAGPNSYANEQWTLTAAGALGTPAAARAGAGSQPRRLQGAAGGPQ